MADLIVTTLARVERSEPAREAAPDVSRFDLTFEGAGRFPERGRPRVVWLGISEGGPSVLQLGAGVSTGLRTRGLRFDDRPLSPHLTLARVPDDASSAEAKTIAAAVESLAAPRLEFRVAQILVGL